MLKVLDLGFSCMKRFTLVFSDYDLHTEQWGCCYSDYLLQISWSCFHLLAIKVICVCFGLTLLGHFFTLSKLNQNWSWFTHTRFPMLRDSYMYLLWVLTASAGCLCPLWLARMISLVKFVFRHLIENRSDIELMF